MSDKNIQSIVLGGGCFWCVEAAYSHTKGIISAVSGYAGGKTKNPTYEEVSGGRTGHAEVVKISYDPAVITLDDILHIFFLIHNPTTPDRQGNDIGTQYRSAIFYNTKEQYDIADKIMKDLAEERVYDQPIVTELYSLKDFYPAEDYHQQYFAKNPEQAYCQAVIAPKLAKFRQKYAQFYK
ncbi:MAG TPA: peptide-methionine (S)-S-oxide reductase MsrA [Candidatus Udaeobacter sp.]|nr:peptide-methionine (S)-S-oxide reductase MsrA [Candidatus Udaeobacter sp.]